MDTTGVRGRFPMQLLAAHRRAVLGVLAVGTAAVGLFVVTRPSGGPGCAAVSGQVQSLAGAGPEAFGDVEAVSLLDATVAGAAHVSGGHYKLCVPPGEYGIVSRSERVSGGRSVEAVAAVTVTSGATGLDVAARFVRQLLSGTPASAAPAGGVVGVARIPLIMPSDFNNAPNAVANGPLETGLVDPCQKAGKRVIPTDPTILDQIKQQHDLADSKLATPLPPINILTPDVVISGNVTVDDSGRPVADITVTDTKTGAVIDHIVIAGDPGQFPKTGIGDPSGFLTRLGKGIAERNCKKVEPTSTTQRVTPGPSQSSSVAAPATSPPGPATYRIIFDGTGTAHDDRPDLGQAYRSADASATWHLEYDFSPGHDGTPDPATARVAGTGSSKSWRGGADCNGASATYQPNASILRKGPEGFRIGVPLAGDLFGQGCDITATDPFSRAPDSSCTPAAETCISNGRDLGAFWTATFVIADGQTGTVITSIPSRTFTHDATAGGGGGGSENAMHTWSGTITVVAQPP